MYTILIIEIPHQFPAPETQLPIPTPESVITQTQGKLNILQSTTSMAAKGLNVLMPILAPAATIGIMAYGFNMMFRGVFGKTGTSRIMR